MTAQRECDLFIMRMFMYVEYHEYVYVCFLLPINNFREEKNSQVTRFGLKD